MGSTASCGQHRPGSVPAGNKGAVCLRVAMSAETGCQARACQGHSAPSPAQTGEQGIHLQGFQNPCHAPTSRSANPLPTPPNPPHTHSHRGTPPVALTWAAAELDHMALTQPSPQQLPVNAAEMEKRAPPPLIITASAGSPPARGTPALRTHLEQPVGRSRDSRSSCLSSVPVRMRMGVSCRAYYGRITCAISANHPGSALPAAGASAWSKCE